MNSQLDWLGNLEILPIVMLGATVTRPTRSVGKVCRKEVIFLNIFQAQCFFVFFFFDGMRRISLSSCVLWFLLWFLIFSTQVA